MSRDPGRGTRLVWGALGGLAFLVLLQGFELATGQRVDWGVKFGVAVAVAVGAVVIASRTGRRLGNENERS